jgi:hypothetical protein
MAGLFWPHSLLMMVVWIGVTVITLTKRLTADYLQLLYSKQHQMSWGYATIHIHKKVFRCASLLTPCMPDIYVLCFIL